MTGRGGSAEEAALFGSRRQEHGGAFRPRLVTCPEPGHFQENGAPRRIVKGAVVDVVRADRGLAGAEMVPMSGEDDRLRLEGRVASFDHADNVSGDDLLDAGWDVSFDADAERNGLETARARLLEGFVHRQSGV